MRATNTTTVLEMVRTDIAYLRELEHRSTVHELTEDDDGQPIRLHPGEMLLVRLPEAPNAEFSWAPSPSAIPDFLRLAANVYDRDGADADAELASDPFERVFAFCVREDVAGANSEPLIIAAQQDWSEENTRKYTLEVRVEPVDQLYQAAGARARASAWRDGIGEALARRGRARLMH